MGIMGIYLRTSIDSDGISIEQQKKEGIKFCKTQDFEYQIYEDEGKSGYKIYEDDPFKNRKGMKNLLKDIENKLIDKVWVYEHSRLSRNDESFIALFKIFKKHNVILYEKNQQFDLNNHGNKMIQMILTAVAEYERQMIVDRTTRGLYDAFDRGHRGYNECYGYKKDGRNEDGYINWIPVESEIANIKYVYEKYFQSQSLTSILLELFDNEEMTENERVAITKKWPRILRRFENTGFSLNTDGLEIYRKFKNCEIDSVRELNDPKYYIKSVSYPIVIISIEEWISVVEKFEKDKLVYREKKRKTDTEMITGIIECPYCEQKFYIHIHGKYRYYKHMVKRPCGQIPKSLNVEKTNDIFKVFLFYFYLVFDDTKELVEESQRRINLNQLDIKEKIKTIESDNKKLNVKIDKFQSIYEKSDDEDLLKLTLMKEKELTQKKEQNHNILLLLKTELEELKKKYEQEELELTYYDTKQVVLDFFEKSSIEEQRTSLIKIIKKCQIFANYLLIDTGKILFIFDVKKEYQLPESEYNEFKNDEYYKEHFLNSAYNDKGKFTKDIEEYLQTPKEELANKYSEIEIIDIENKYILHLMARFLGDMRINEYQLNTTNAKTDMEAKLQNLGIDYSLLNIKQVISFTDDI